MMDDYISRQAALDCFHDWIDQHGDVHTADEMVEYQRIEALPSAQTELCEYYALCRHGRDEEKLRARLGLDDYISRQAAIDLIERMKPYHQDADDIAEMIDNMPSAQPVIIRCKDCQHWDIHKRLNIPWCRKMHIDRRAEDFCSDAKRRTDE